MPKSITLTQALMWARAFGRRLLLAARAQRATQERHLREPHSYGRILGVRTALQGQGLGSASCSRHSREPIRPGYRCTFQAGSERSAALYERLGFLQMDVLELPEGGPPVRLMRRPPAGSTTHHVAHR